jgi:hypothetical protein
MHIEKKANIGDAAQQNLRSKDIRGGAADMALPQHTAPQLCPFVAMPFQDCYCASTSSVDVESTILFCGGEYRKCEIYVRNNGNG